MAKIIVPEIMSMTETRPHSVIDVGCGVGAWLKVFKDLGVTEVLGIDGDYIPNKMMMIEKNEFYPQDLKQDISLNKKFDVAISIEVAEHINKKYASNFIKNLTNLSDIIVFSAAIPKQGGTHHVNEQWPTYWIKIFNKLNYEAFDVIRPKILWRTDVYEICKQNIFVIVNKNSKHFNYFKKFYPPFLDDMVIVSKLIFVRNRPLSFRIPHLFRKHILKIED
jgi:SAM-dependent methyltransferase